MKRFFLICMLMIFVLLSCQTNQESIRQAEAHRLQAEAFMKHKKYTLALRELLKAEQYYDKDPYLQNDLGLVYMEKNSLDLAIRHFKRALELKPDYPSAKNNLGVAYLRAKQWDNAIGCFKELLGNLVYATPQKPMVNLGWAYYNKKEYVLAEKSYNDALDLYRDGLAKDLDYYKCLYGLSLVYMDTEKMESAVKTLNLILKGAPRTHEIYFKLAEAYSAQKEFDKAERAYRKVIELAPESELADKARIALFDMADKKK